MLSACLLVKDAPCFVSIVSGECDSFTTFVKKIQLVDFAKTSNHQGLGPGHWSKARGGTCTDCLSFRCANDLFGFGPWHRVSYKRCRYSLQHMQYACVCWHLDQMPVMNATPWDGTRTYRHRVPTLRNTAGFPRLSLAHGRNYSWSDAKSRQTVAVSL